MITSQTSRNNVLVWKVKTLDDYPLQLTRSSLERIISQLPKQPELKNLVKRKYRGNLEQAVARSIAQLTRDALYTGGVSHSKFRHQLRAFKTPDIEAKNYQILAFPLSKTESAIVDIREVEHSEGEGESGPAQCGYLLDILRRLLGISANTSIGDAIKTIYTTESNHHIKNIRFGQGQVKGKGTGQANAANKPDISYYDGNADVRVNIEIDLNTPTGVQSSETHEANLIGWDEKAVGIFLIVNDSGEVNRNLSRIYQPFGLDNTPLAQTVKDVIGDNFNLLAKTTNSNYGSGKIRKFKLT